MFLIRPSFCVCPASFARANHLRVCCQPSIHSRQSRQHTITVPCLSVIHRRQLILCELVLVLLMRPLERLPVSWLSQRPAVARLTATQARIDVEIGAGSETLEARTSARSLGMNFGTVYGKASTLGCQQSTSHSFSSLPPQSLTMPTRRAPPREAAPAWPGTPG